jgi:hypothetical protein
LLIDRETDRIWPEDGTRDGFFAALLWPSSAGGEDKATFLTGLCTRPSHGREMMISAAAAKITSATRYQIRPGRSYPA